MVDGLEEIRLLLVEGRVWDRLLLEVGRQGRREGQVIVPVPLLAP